MTLKQHKKRKKRVFHDLDALVQFIWDDLANIEQEIEVLLARA